MKNQTWSLCDFPIGKKAIDTKWIFKLKLKLDGSIDHYKARLGAKAYAQEKDIDFDKTFSLICCMTTIFHICALIAYNNWNVY